MKSTGERFIPGSNGPIELEHIHRYWLASQHTSGKTVLDIACGEGYGSHILALNAQRVTGVDISPEAVDHAANRYKKANLTYKLGSCSAIPADDDSIDVAISFETIEHHDQHEDMMKEIKRVLKPAGLLIISSPEKHAYSDRRNYKNPFHVKELYQEEFEELIEKHFKHHLMYAQRLVTGSLISKNGLLSTPSQHALTRDENAIIESDIPPWYLIAFASDSDIDMSCDSILESDLDSFLEAVVAPERLNAEEQITYRQALADDLNNLLVAEKDNAKAQIMHRDNIIAELQAEKANAVAQITYQDSVISELESLMRSRKSLFKLFLNPRRQQ